VDLDMTPLTIRLSYLISVASDPCKPRTEFLRDEPKLTARQLIRPHLLEAEDKVSFSLTILTLYTSKFVLASLVYWGLVLQSHIRYLVSAENLTVFPRPVILLEHLLKLNFSSASSHLAANHFKLQGLHVCSMQEQFIGRYAKSHNRRSARPS